MNDLIRIAYRGAQLAFLIFDEAGSSEKLDQWVAGAENYLDEVDVIGFLHEVCASAVEAAEMGELDAEDQEMVWRAHGILDVCRLMPELWKDGFVSCGSYAVNSAGGAVNREAENELSGILEGVD